MASYLTGRYIAFHIYTLSFEESASIFRKRRQRPLSDHPAPEKQPSAPSCKSNVKGCPGDHTG